MTFQGCFLPSFDSFGKVVSDKLDPGSTVKPFTMLLALEKKKITAKDDELLCQIGLHGAVTKG
jgi:cell division protein FtsI/penicillin-binding protein 2